MKNLVFVKTDKLGMIIAEVPTGHIIKAGEEVIVSNGRRLAAPIQEGLASSDSQLMSDEAGNWIINYLNPSASRYYIKGINHTEAFIW